MADTDVAERARARQNRYWKAIFLPLVLTGPLAGLFAFLVMGGSAGDLGLAGWLILGIAAVEPLVIVGLFAWGRRRGFSQLQPALIFGVDRHRRKEIRAAVRTGRPVSPDEQAIAADLAHRMVGQRWVTYYGPALGAFVILSQSLSLGDVGVGDMAVIATGLFMIASSLLTLRDVRRARRWLADHGEPAAAS